MRILGVDPGLGRLGWGIIDTKGLKISPQGFGCIETSTSFSEEQRIKQIYLGLEEIISNYTPDLISLEELFFSRNVTTAFMVGQARGVVLLVAGLHNLSVASYSPAQVKLAVTGYGKAEKKQIGQMVKVILKLEKLPRLDDTTDALAIALTHAFSGRMTESIK